jgi:hypothetical protein
MDCALMVAETIAKSATGNFPYLDEALVVTNRYRLAVWRKAQRVDGPEKLRGFELSKLPTGRNVPEREITTISISHANQEPPIRGKR